ncbi:MAG: AAA family ATPase [Planctomycetaceae bacterium]|jgi:shikimate kinase|nr:AAA family ATPase [Planctomycetaceae bacterium]
MGHCFAIIYFLEMPVDAKNIVVIGLPSCGKTTLCRIVAEKLSMNFIDIDEAVLERIRPTKSDSSFLEVMRRFPVIQSEIIRELKNNTQSTIVATGGEAVTCDENTKNLRAFGFVIYIQRDRKLLLEKAKERFPFISISSSDGDDELEKEDASSFIFHQYESTAYLYEKAANAVLINNGTIEEGTEKLIALIQNVPLQSKC